MTPTKLRVLILATLWTRLRPYLTVLPAQGLPERYWRWLWVAMVFRLLVGVPVFLILIGPYLLARAYVAAADALGNLLGNVLVKCYNRDLANSGWRPGRLPAPRLNPEWADREGS